MSGHLYCFPPGRAAGEVNIRGGALVGSRAPQLVSLGQADYAPDMNQPAPAFIKEDPWRVLRIMGEFVESFETLSHVGPAVTVFGSARTKPADKYYRATVDLARQLAERQIPVITGGGPGIMEAANKGAALGQGKSIGLNIELPHEQHGNRYVNLPVNFHYFFSRKVCLVKYSTAFVYMPGGFGTLDEFFEVLTLVQTERIPKFPLILFGSSYWSGLLRWAKKALREDHQFISPKDLQLVTLTDRVADAVALITDYRHRVGPPQTTARAFA